MPARSLSLAVGALLCLQGLGTARGGEAATYDLRPTGKTAAVNYAPQVLSAATCKRLVRLAQTLPNVWDTLPDSIDGHSAMQIDVFSAYSDPKGVAHVPQIYEAIEGELEAHLKPWAASAHGSGVSLFWVFLRKYQSGGARHSLAAHTDSNARTVNILLNEDFTGGDLYFVEPGTELERMVEETRDTGLGQGVAAGRLASARFGSLLANVTIEHPDFHRPPLRTGTALTHTRKVLHGVLDVTGGVKYTLILFFRADAEARAQCEAGEGRVYEEASRACSCKRGYKRSQTRSDNTFWPCAEVREGRATGGRRLGRQLRELGLHGDPAIKRALKEAGIESVADLSGLEEEDMLELGCFSKAQRARLLAWQATGQASPGERVNSPGSTRTHNPREL